MFSIDTIDPSFAFSNIIWPFGSFFNWKSWQVSAIVNPVCFYDFQKPLFCLDHHHLQNMEMIWVFKLSNSQSLPYSVIVVWLPRSRFQVKYDPPLRFGNLGVVRTLLDAGAHTEMADSDGCLRYVSVKSGGEWQGNIEDPDSDEKETQRILRKSNGHRVHLRLKKTCCLELGSWEKSSLITCNHVLLYRDSHVIDYHIMQQTQGSSIQQKTPRRSKVFDPRRQKRIWEINMSFFSEDLASGLPCYFQYILDSWSGAYRLEKPWPQETRPRHCLGNGPSQCDGWLVLFGQVPRIDEY